MIIKMPRYNTGGEFTALIIDLNRESNEEFYREVYDAMSFRETKTQLIVDIGDNPDHLKDIAESLEYWGDPNGGFTSDVSFRFRPFQRMAKEIRIELENM